ETLKFGWCGEHWAESASFGTRPEKQRESDQQQEWCGNALQEADGFDAAQNDQDIQQPEKEETDHRAESEVRPASVESNDNGVYGFAADPSLNAKPSTGD